MAAKSDKKRVIAVGGGFASVKLALELAHDDHFEVILMAPHQELEYHGALYRSATGRSPLEVSIPFREIFKNAPNVQIINDFMTELRAQSNEIKGQSGRIYHYDALVLGIGYEIEYFGIRGMREHAESMYTVFDTIKLRNQMRDIFIKKQGQECKITLIGGGPTGTELACDISIFANIVSEAYHTKPAKPKVTIVDRADRILPQLSPEVSKIAAARLKELGVGLKLNMAVDHCTKQHVCLGDKEIMQSDIVIWTAGSRANSFFERYPDIFSLDPRKRVYVNEYMQANSADIYVIGDGASTQYSGMAQTAINDAIQLAANFKRYVRDEPIQPYVAEPPIYVVPMGGEWAVAQQGDKVSSGTSAWKVRRQADLDVMNSFLDKRLAEKHWQKAFEIAEI